MRLSLTDFVTHEKNRLEKFEIWWSAMNKKDPQAYPMVFEHGNEGIWWEQFQEFQPEWLEALEASGAL